MPRKAEIEFKSNTPAPLETIPRKTIRHEKTAEAEGQPSSSRKKTCSTAAEVTAADLPASPEVKAAKPKIAEAKAADKVQPPEAKPRTVQKYKSEGVLMSLELPPVYEPVKITYEGLLAQNGATELYARAGIGPQWDNTLEVKMTKVGDSFEGAVLAVKSSTLNVCFRDAAYNWDNNSNENYVFTMTI